MGRLPSGTVAFLFTDLEGSTRLWERHPQAMEAAYVRHDAILRGAAAAGGGIVYNVIGDAIQIAFPTASAAIAAALTAQRALTAEPWPTPEPLRVRVALHVCSAEPDAAGDYRTPNLNRLGRLLAAGHGGQVLVSAVTAELARGALPEAASLRDLGEHRFRDLLQAEHVYQLVAPGLEFDFPPIASLDRFRHNLPAQPTALIGRDAEVAEVRQLLGRPGVRCLTLTGPGGTGKTRLALQVAAEVAEDFSDGVYFVGLAAIADPGLVLPTIAQTLGMRETGDLPLVESLAGFIGGQQMLLLLDNFEQVLGAAPAVGRLLSRCPRVTVLATSRAPLRIAGEQEYAVPPLPLPWLDPGGRRWAGDPTKLVEIASVRLFVERAAAIRPGFAVTAENASDVAEICRRLDGLPLAIELAAARVRLLAPPAMLARLEKRLPLLTGGARDLPERQQTLRHAIAWSYDLLSPAERTLFARLAVFAGGASLESVEAVCAGIHDAADAAIDVLDGLVVLAEQSLLRQVEGPDGSPRVAMLATIREFALEHLEATGETEALRDRHAAYFLKVAERAGLELSGSEQAVWLDRLEADHDNFRAALGWSLANSDDARGLRLARALVPFWRTRGYLGEGVAWMDQALAAEQTAPPGMRAKSLYCLGELNLDLGNYERAETAFGESLALRRQAGDRAEIAESLTGLGVIAGDREAYAEARDYHEEALAIRRELGDKRGLARSLYNLGDLAREEGNLAGARRFYLESLGYWQEVGDPDRIAYQSWSLGLVARLEGSGPLAQSLFEQALASFRAIGDKYGIFNAVIELGHTARLTADIARAGRLYAEALELSQTISSQPGLVEALEGLAAVAEAQGQRAIAARLLGAATAGREQLRLPVVPVADRAALAVRVATARAHAITEWDAGERMTLEAAAVEALTLVAPEPIAQTGP